MPSLKIVTHLSRVKDKAREDYCDENYLQTNGVAKENLLPDRLYSLWGKLANIYIVDKNGMKWPRRAHAQLAKVSK